MFRWIRETFGHRRGGVHTRIATFRPTAAPPDPRAVAVEYSGRELYGGKRRLECGCIDVCTNQRDHERPYAGKVYTATFDAMSRQLLSSNAAAVERTLYGGTIHENLVQLWPNGERMIGGDDFERMAEEHDADRYDAASL